MLYNIYHKIAWLICFIGGIFSLFWGGLTFVAMFQGPIDEGFLIQGSMSFGVGAICWGVAAVIDLLRPEPI